MTNLIQQLSSKIKKTINPAWTPDHLTALHDDLILLAAANLLPNGQTLSLEELANASGTNPKFDTIISALGKAKDKALGSVEASNSTTRTPVLCAHDIPFNTRRMPRTGHFHVLFDNGDLEKHPSSAATKSALYKADCTQIPQQNAYFLCAFHHAAQELGQTRAHNI